MHRRAGHRAPDPGAPTSRRGHSHRSGIQGPCRCEWRERSSARRTCAGDCGQSVGPGRPDQSDDLRARLQPPWSDSACSGRRRRSGRCSCDRCANRPPKPRGIRALSAKAAAAGDDVDGREGRGLQVAAIPRLSGLQAGHLVAGAKEIPVVHAAGYASRSGSAVVCPCALHVGRVDRGRQVRVVGTGAEHTPFQSPRPPRELSHRFRSSSSSVAMRASAATSAR